jgi:hypothetical protein
MTVMAIVGYTFSVLVFIVLIYGIISYNRWWS